MVAKRNKALKLKLFPDHEDREQWEFEEDIMNLSVVKQNDGQLHTLNMVFNPVNFKILPRLEQNINEANSIEIPTVEIKEESQPVEKEESYIGIPASEDDYQGDGRSSGC